MAARHNSKFDKRERGASQIEFALTLVLVLNVVFWTWELCMMVYTKTVLAQAANEGVRYAIVNSSDTSGTLTTARVKTYAGYSLNNVSGITVVVAYPDGSQTPSNRVSVTITYVYVPFFAKLLPSPPTLHAYAEGRIVY